MTMKPKTGGHEAPNHKAEAHEEPKKQEAHPQEIESHLFEMRMEYSKEAMEAIKPSEPSIRLEFFRHDDKLKAEPGQHDNQVRLNPKGRAHARTAGKQTGLNPEMAIIYGSPRERSVETGYQRLFGEESGTSAEMSLEEMIAKVNSNIKYGKKHGVKKNLDFTFEGSPAMSAALKKHFGETKDLTTFMFEESDKMAQENKDVNSNTFSRNAANIASIIKKYLHSLPRWEQITKTSDKKEHYEHNGNQIQRLFGTHGSVLEPFLLRLIKHAEGETAARDFIKTMPDGNSFDFSEGYSITISRNNKGVPIITVTHKNLNFEITEDLLDRIISERK